MIMHNYSPIISHATKQIFFDYIKTLNIPYIDYFAVGIQNNRTKQSMSLMSRPTWQQHFIENNYAAYDPVRRITLYTKKTLIPFDCIDYIDNFGKEIMRQRAMMGMKNGLILMQRFDEFNYILTLSTDFSQFDTFDFIKKHYEQLKIIQEDFISCIALDAKKFLSQTRDIAFNHPYDDAK